MIVMLKILKFLLIFSSFLFSQYERPGSTSAQFLKIDISPAAAAMAGSYYSVAKGATALYYNPAAIASMDQKIDIVFNKTRWFAILIMITALLHIIKVDMVPLV